MAESLDTKEIGELLKILSEYDVTEFRLVRGDERLSLKRGRELQVMQESAAAQSVVTPVGASPFVVAEIPHSREDQALAPQAVGQPGPGKAAEADKKESLVDIPSPMVGTFYKRPAVDAEPYVEVGDRVKKGDVLCIVEAMKLMNEIESSVSGLIVEICLEDAQMVEYGEVLFRIDPKG